MSDEVQVKKYGPFKIDEPVEVRIDMGSRVMHLVAWRTDSGLVGHSLSVGGHGTPQALSNLQAREPFPGKAVPGWQMDIVVFAMSGLGKVVEVR